MKLIKFKNKKTKEQFIKDVAGIRFSIAMLETVCNHNDFDGELLIPDVDKSNKDIKKIKACTENLKNLINKISDKISAKDNEIILNFSTSFAGTMFKIMNPHSGVSIPHICMYMLEKLLNRDNVYYKFRVITRAWGVKRVVKIFEKHKIEADKKDKFIGYSLAGAIASQKLKV